MSHFPASVRQHYPAARDFETPDEVLSFWRELLQWKLGTGFNLVTEPFEPDPWDQDMNRREVTIRRANKVVMLVFIAQTWDDDTEAVLAQAALSYIGLSQGVRISVLFCQGLQCKLMSIEANSNGDLDVVQDEEILDTESAETIEVIRWRLEDGIANGIVPPRPENWAWAYVPQRFWNSVERRWAPRNGQEDVERAT